MSDIIAQALPLLKQVSNMRPVFGQFDLFVLLTGKGMFPVPYFALIYCLMRRLTFNNDRINAFLMRILCNRVKSSYFGSNLPLSSRKSLSYLAEIFMNVGDFSTATIFLSGVHPWFLENPQVGIHVSCAYLLVTQLYHMPIQVCDYSRIVVDVQFNDAIDAVLGFLVHALQSETGITDSELWFAISTLLFALTFKMDENQKICSEFRPSGFGSEDYFSTPDISPEQKAENHAQLWRLSVELRGLLHHCLQRPFFQRKLQKLSVLLRKFCPDISENDLRRMTEALFESGFSDLSVIAWYEFLISLDLTNPSLSVSRFHALTDACSHEGGCVENAQILPQLRSVAIQMLQRCGITEEVFPSESVCLHLNSRLLSYILRCIKRMEEEEEERQLEEERQARRLWLSQLYDSQ
jgi:hypothetical protein